MRAFRFLLTLLVLAVIPAYVSAGDFTSPGTRAGSRVLTNPMLGGYLDLNSYGTFGTGYLTATTAFDFDTPIIVESTVTSQGGPGILFGRTDSTPAVSDYLGFFSFQGKNSSGSTVEYASFNGLIADPTAGTEDGLLAFAGVANGVAVNFFVADAFGLAPGSTDSGALGKSTQQWSDLFLAEGGVINWDNGDQAITQTNDVLTLTGGTQYVFNNTASLSVNSLGGMLQSYGTTNGTGAETHGLFDTTAGDYPRYQFYRSKNAAIGSATVIASGDSLGGIEWWGAQQTGTFATQTQAAGIYAESDTTVTSGASADMPGRLKLCTTADASGTCTTRLTIDSAGLATFANNLTVGTSNSITAGTIELGAASDTTLTRSAAGIPASEGVVLLGVTNVAAGSLPAAATQSVTVPAYCSQIVVQVTGWSQATNTARLFVRIGTSTGDATAGNYVGNSINTTTVTNFTTNGAASTTDGGTQTVAQTGSATVTISGGPATAHKTFQSRVIANTAETLSIGTYIGATTTIDTVLIGTSAAGNFDAGTYRVDCMK